MRLWIKYAERKRKVFQSTFHPTDCQYLESFDCVGPDDFIKLVRFVLEVKKDSVVNLQQYCFNQCKSPKLANVSSKFMRTGYCFFILKNGG